MKQEEKIKKTYETIQTAAKRVETTPLSLLRAIHSGELPAARRPGARRWRIRPEHVDMWIRGEEIPQEEKAGA